MQILFVEVVHLVQGLFASCCRGEVQGTALVLDLTAHSTRWQPMQNHGIKPLGFEGKDRRKEV